MHGTLRTHIIIFADVCLDGTQCRQGSLDAPDATRYGAWVQDAQDAQDAESRLGESGRRVQARRVRTQSPGSESQDAESRLGESGRRVQARRVRTQSPGSESQDPTLQYLTQATFLLMSLSVRSCIGRR